MRAGAAGAALLLFLSAGALSAHAGTAIPGSVLSKAGAGSEVVLGGPVTLNADRLSYDEAAGIAIAEGNVEVGFGNRSIRADRIRYDARTGEADLSGRVHYKDAGDEFSFDRIVLNIDTELGVLYNGSIRLSSNNYLIASEKFEKTGPRTFRIQKGTLTTCPCDPDPDWSFDVRRSQVTIDGYALAKDVTFRVRGVPVLWLPWAAFPVKLSRQSGFLMPSFLHSGTKGYALQLPYYWAISRWSDATVTLEAMSRRGLRPEVEYRYVLNPRSEGEAHASFYHDKETGRDRYRANGKSTYLGGGWTSNAKWDVASDDAYYVDLVEEDILRTGRHVPSRGFVGYGGDRASGALSAAYVDDIQGTPDDNTVQRLPELSMNILPGQIGGSRIDGAAEAEATYFYRRVGERDLRGRGTAELSRTFTLRPAVTFTPYVSVEFLRSRVVSGGAAGGDAGRVLPGGGASLAADLRRDFQGGAGSRLIHMVRTAASFRWIPTVDQRNIPLTDAWSRVGEQQQFGVAVTQRLLRVGGAGGPYEVAFLALEWALDVGGRKATGSPYIDPMSPFVRSLRDQVDLAAGRATERRAAASDVSVRFRVHPRTKWSLSGETLFDAGDGRFTTAALGGEWQASEVSRATVEYRRSRDLAEDVNGNFDVRLHRMLGLKTGVNYSVRNDKLVEGTAALTLYPSSDCWSVGLETNRRTKPDETSYKLLFSLKGIGSVGK